MALAASVISVRLGISVALVEILVGTVVGNLPNASDYVQQTEFTTFLASLGSVMLTFLAGAEIDPVSLRRRWKASRSIGLVSFLLPFLGGPGVLPLGTRTGSEAKVAGKPSREGRARTASTRSSSTSTSTGSSPLARSRTSTSTATAWPAGVSSPCSNWTS